MTILTKVVAPVLLLMVCSASANATLISISTSDNLVRQGMDNQGWWGNDFINNNPTNDNYITAETTYRGYFTFDLSGILGIVTSATLELRRYDTDAGATLSLYDVSTSASDLAQREIVDNAIYSDLGSGTSYGSFLAGAGVSTELMSFALNGAALADITAGLGNYFSIGATSTNGTHFSSSSDEPGNSSTNFIQRLVLNVESNGQVPAPATLALFGLGLAGLGWSRRKKV